ncbi:MAG: hypothetical protein ACD_2C00220G0004 [uncultured bacterium (gcode 4)]|uniref:Uncharacterized protein n=1 Tax=uncultured bacterium (gcode 4) TaxID=1234023 RepID=K2FDJ9_9BACT|nr:MAG: hypothetical protein ACD_2C00220G0004 [uncultured bacterium (gcode 4)]
MKSQIKALTAIFLILGLTSVFAAETTEKWASETWGTQTVAADDAGVDAEAGLDADSIWDEDAALADSWAEADLNAGGKELVIAPKGWIGNYVEVACDKDFFTQNACNQCFDWGKKAVGEKVTWLTDSWTNPNTTEQVIYKDEQKFPELISLGWVWGSNPQEPEKFWKYSEELTWTDSATGSGKQEFLLEWGKMTWFLESDLGAAYVLQSTDKKEWEATWLLKFTINYHDTDATAKESAAKVHTECVAYYAWVPAPVTPVPVTPQEVTQVKTGPESLILILVALVLSFWLLKFRKKA